MGTLTVQSPGESGADITFAAADAGGDVAANNEHDVVLLVKNDDASGKTVTITAQKTTTDKRGYGSVTKSNAAHTVAAGAIAVIGPFSNAFNNSSGQIAITYDAVTSLTIAAVKAPLAL